jgi:hypothetical protein
MHRLTPERNEQVFNELNVEAELNRLWDQYILIPKGKSKERIEKFLAYLVRRIEVHHLVHEATLGNYITGIEDEFRMLHSRCSLLKTELSERFASLPVLPDSNTCPISGLTGLKEWMEQLLQNWDPVKSPKVHDDIPPIQARIDAKKSASKITKDEVCQILRKRLPQLTKIMPLKDITIRFMAIEIGCSTGLISNCSPWKAFCHARDGKSQRCPTVTRLDEVSADRLVAPDKSPCEIVSEQEELDNLIREQKTDMQNQEGKNISFPHL